MPFNLRHFGLGPTEAPPPPFTGLQHTCEFHGEKPSYMQWQDGEPAPELQTATISIWFRRTAFFAVNAYLLSAGQGSPNQRFDTNLRFLTDHRLAAEVFSGGITYVNLVTTATFTDQNWHHVVFQLNLGADQTADRANLYVDGLLPALDISGRPGNSGINHGLFGTQPHRLGQYVDTGIDGPLYGLMADVNLIQGAVVAPDAFGEFVGPDWFWQDYQGSHGVNGRRFQFLDEDNLGRNTSA